MGRAMFTKSLIQFSVDGWGCVPSLLFTWGQTMVEVMKICDIPWADEAPAGIKTAGRNINNLRYKDNTTLRAESKEELKSLLIELKKEGEKVGLKLNIQKSKIMVSGPISSVQFSSVPQLCPPLCDPMDYSTPGHPVNHQLPEFTQTNVL